MCMTKNDLINDIIASLSVTIDKEQTDMIKAVFIVKMQAYDIHEINTLPSVEVVDNDYILKRFTVDMLAKGVKESSIKTYINAVRPFLDYAGVGFTEITAQHVTDYMAIKKVSVNALGRKNTQNYVAGICRMLFVFFQWAYRKRHIREDIMRDVDRIRAKQKKKDRITPEEIESIVKAIGKRAGVHCVTTVHIYRKTFASETYKRTGNIKMVSILLGHSSTAITEKYYLIDDMKDIEYQALYVA